MRSSSHACKTPPRIIIHIFLRRRRHLRLPPLDAQSPYVTRLTSQPSVSIRCVSRSGDYRLTLERHGQHFLSREPSFRTLSAEFLRSTGCTETLKRCLKSHYCNSLFWLFILFIDFHIARPARVDIGTESTESSSHVHGLFGLAAAVSACCADQ